MNFDDLHDPQPPRPGSAALVAVTGRARQIRRRRAALATAGGMLAAAAVVVPATLAVTGGDDEGGRIVPATAPEATSLPVTSVPEPTLPPPTEPPPTPPPPTVPATLLSSAVVAIHGNGDAVFVDANGRETVVFDGADPNDPPAEGDLTAVDRVVRTPDGRTFVSTCCEPVPGSYLEIGADGRPIESSLVYGHALALSPDGTRIASVGASAITIADLDGHILASADLTTAIEGRSPDDVMWIDDETLAVIERRQPELDSWLFTTDADLRGVADAFGADLGGSLDLTAPRFGGLADDGSILVYRGERGGDVSDRLEAYDPVTLAARPGSDITMPDAGVSAWYDDGRLIWVGLDDVLWVDGIEVPGEFAWARPVAG